MRNEKKETGGNPRSGRYFDRERLQKALSEHKKSDLRLGQYLVRDGVVVVKGITTFDEAASAIEF